MVHLAFLRRKKQPFTDDKREELLGVLKQIEPSPSKKHLDQMMTAAERVVTGLSTARREEKEESDLAVKVEAVRKLHNCAQEMRDACNTVFMDKSLRNSLKIPLITGVLRKIETGRHSKSDIDKTLKYIFATDVFSDFGEKLVIYLDGVRRGTSNILAVMDDAVRIKDSADYLFTMVLAYQWLKIFGVRPKSKNFDKRFMGKTAADPTLFQDFVRALPIDRGIKAETVRTVVACIREWSPQEPNS